MTSYIVRAARKDGRERLAESLPHLSVNEIGIECDALLAAVLDCSTTALIARLNEELCARQVDLFFSYIKRRSRREPVAYIVGSKEFYGRTFVCNERTLIPRPDSETLVEAVLALYQDSFRPSAIHDIGCGTGCLGLSIAAELEALGWIGRLTLSDISLSALRIAAQNTAALQLTSEVELWCADLLSSTEEIAELTVANLPYIPNDEELMDDVQLFEPVNALRSGTRGLDHITRLLSEWVPRARTGMRLFLEIGANQWLEVESLAHAMGVSELRNYRDLSGSYRVVELRR